MSFAEELSNLGKEINASFDARVNFLGKNITDVKNMQLDAKKLISHFSKDRKAMGRKLRADLGGFVEDLTDTVDGLKAKFHKEQNAIHRECKEAHSAWMGAAKSMTSKRRNFGGNLTKAKQKASQKSH
ncbi:MAG: hypothetical protein A3G32_03810 [Deltaproteobacteria bacterium RIFCSPLOWO2_12_FULL_40_28]|nr:MAG: hypothetical protein A3C45_05700 [Deltaproteobacteria bacterium RIFCSPHIGHO2_02_FULL_40_28]OGQ19447.1 MAG: hypothetical protein A3E27_06330 [Deltaproteobacteria bacterium RIFCSPHIGHO2_12_FULL_40_32]OGQ39891.1 MAG: hypothetical protein A3I69_07295 [Deltaproteobacteria bacterium RIFCSPLOWO2_02_FULL_40_36]OGQ53884.1 MAG: hypothetical protein A3G32_03810 [Deltaproteobacteria bacterium RIFCSPLOWO2_12_FULL_40_28]